MEAMAGVLELLPEWGILGAFILTVGLLVGVFTGTIKYILDLFIKHVKDSQDSLREAHRQCEDRIEEMTNKALVALKEHSASNERLIGLVNRLVGRSD